MPSAEVDASEGRRLQPSHGVEFLGARADVRKGKRSDDMIPGGHVDVATTGVVQTTLASADSHTVPEKTKYDSKAPWLVEKCAATREGEGEK